MDYYAEFFLIPGYSTTDPLGSDSLFFWLLKEFYFS